MGKRHRPAAFTLGSVVGRDDDHVGPAVRKAIAGSLDFPAFAQLDRALPEAGGAPRRAFAPPALVLRGPVAVQACGPTGRGAGAV